jgi:hypothetical protein
MRSSPQIQIQFLVTRLPIRWQHLWPAVDPLFSQGGGSFRMPGKDLTPARTGVLALCAAFFAVIAMLAVTPLSAQSTSTYTEYAAKFICGVPTGTLLTHDTVGNAEYATSINIHNPNLFTTDQPISFLKKAVRTKMEGDTPIAPSAFKQDSLPNDYAEYVDCYVIRQLLGSAAPAAPAFIEGFLVIVVPPASGPNQLDVVGVYTSSNNPPVSLQVVPIAPRIVAPPPAGAVLDGSFK